MESQQIHCEYKQYNNKKKEYVYCKLPVCVNKNGLHYCGNHLPLGEEGPNGKMIKCNLCNQIIGEKIMNKHIKKCEVRKKERDTQILSNENIITPRIWIKKQFKIRDIPLTEIESLKMKILTIYKTLSINVLKREIISPEIKDQFKNEQLNGKNGKTIFQEISIFENLKKEKYFDFNRRNCFIELGCGAGSLSRTVQIGCNYNSSHILIDRMKYNSKNKYDNVIKSQLIGDNFISRKLIDIKDFSIQTEINNKDINVIAISKHLCGDACELSLNKIIEYKERISFAIATCCHYLLNHSNYCNMFFIHSVGITDEEFDYLTRLTGWASLKEDSNNYVIGKMIKEILDYGRLLYLEKNSFQSLLLLEYTTQTKENHLIMGYKLH